MADPIEKLEQATDRATEPDHARKYARSQNCRFVILSNGNLHYFWDLERGNPYVITSYPTPSSVRGYRQMTRPDVEEAERKNYQKFNSDAAGVNGAMLTLAVVTILFPDVLAQSGMISHCALLDFSRYVSIVMLLMYCVYIFFQLKYEHVLGRAL